MSEQSGTRIFVGNLSTNVSKEDLELEFSKYGKITSVWLAFNPPGFVFIHFERFGDAETACENLNGVDAFRCGPIRVEMSKGRTSSSSSEDDDDDNN